MSESNGAILFPRWNKRRKLHYVVVVVLTLLFGAGGVAAKPTVENQVFNNRDNQCPAECFCLGNVVDCSGAQLLDAPSGLPPWAEVL